MTAVSADSARKIAGDALVSGLAGDALASSRGRLLDPIPVQSPAGEPAGWLVPVGLDEHLLGFIQLLNDGSFHRYSSFARGGFERGGFDRKDDSAAGTQSIDEWFNPTCIHARVRQLVGDDASIETPVLSYDRHIDRIAWLVRTRSEKGETSEYFVAGEAIWEADRHKGD